MLLYNQKRLTLIQRMGIVIVADIIIRENLVLSTLTNYKLVIVFPSSILNTSRIKLVML